MDRRITFRFYKVTRHQKAQMTFGNALTQIGNIPHATDRERQLGTDFYARAEQISSVHGSLAGEMTRIQKTNMPSEIDGDHRLPLSTGNPLGHSVVFRYLPGSGDLGIQYDPRVLSPTRFLQYVGSMLDNALFELEPIVRDDMWDRFRTSPIRKVSIAIARPNHVERLDRGPAAAATTSLRNMAEAYEAPKIVIEMSMGTGPGALSDSVKGLVGYFRRKLTRDEIEVSRMKATIKPPNEQSEEIDLLEDILSIKRELPLRDNDPDANYTLKINALQGAMNEWIK